MARPQRNNVDYFPFYCEEGKKMFYLEETYGNDGFAVFLKILRELAKTDYHYLDLSKNTTLMFLSAKCKVSKDILLAIINDLVDLEKFDAVLWNENKIIWCNDFIDSIQDAYNKRINKCITYERLLDLLISLGVRKPSKSKTKEGRNPQTKVDYNKANESKLDKIKEYCSDGLFSYWITWLNYRRDIKKTYKTETSELAAYNKLLKLSSNNNEIAKDIITQSIENDWVGFFELKNKPSANISESFNLTEYLIPNDDAFGLDQQELIKRCNEGFYKKAF